MVTNSGRDRKEDKWSQTSKASQVDKQTYIERNNRNGNKQESLLNLQTE